MSPIGAIGKRHRLRPRGAHAPIGSKAWQRAFAGKRNRSRFPTEPARMNPRADCLREWRLNALTVLLAGLLITSGARAHAQATGQAPTAGSGACVGDNGGVTLSPG